MAKNRHSGFGKVAVLTGAFFSGLAGIASAQDNKPVPKTLENSFDYASHRTDFNGIYKGKIFNYTRLPNGSIVQSDKPGVKIEEVYFWDIDNDGKFGKAELDALNSGIQIFMNPAFNDVANPKVKKFLELANEYNSIKEKLTQTEKDSEIKDYNHQIIEKMYHTLFDQLLKDLIDAKAQIAAGTPKQGDTPYEELYRKRMAEAPAPAQPAAPQTPKPEKDYRSVWLQAQQTANGDLNSYITSIGARWNPFQKVNIGFEASLDIGFGLDKQTDSSNGTFAGVNYSGTNTDVSKFSIGPSFGMQFGPFFCDAGFDYKVWTQEIKEKIGNKSNINSVPNRQAFGKFDGGVKIPLGDNFELGVLGGYNGRDGGFFGFRGGLKLK